MQRGISTAAKRYENASGGALYLQMTRTLNEATPLVPVDTGRLRASQFVSAPSKSTGRLTVRGGFGTLYAVPVHERHPTKKKFLRIAFDNQKTRAAKNIALDTRRLVKEGKGFGDINHQFPTKPKLTG